MKGLPLSRRYVVNIAHQWHGLVKRYTRRLFLFGRQLNKPFFCEQFFHFYYFFFSLQRTCVNTAVVPVSPGQTSQVVSLDSFVFLGCFFFCNFARAVFFLSCKSMRREFYLVAILPRWSSFTKCFTGTRARCCKSVTLKQRSIACPFQKTIQNKRDETQKKQTKSKRVKSKARGGLALSSTGRLAVAWPADSIA